MVEYSLFFSTAVSLSILNVVIPLLILYLFFRRLSRIIDQVRGLEKSANYIRDHMKPDK